MLGGEGHILATLGLLLASALLAGLLADFVRLPKVTAYLLVGIVLGPSVLDLLAEHHMETLHPLTQLAMGLVLLDLGCQFPISQIRRIARRLIRLAVGEMGLTFVCVSLGLFLCGVSWEVALLLGTLALATAPATTILVLKEAESEGPVTESTEALVIVNNLSAIVIFELTLLALYAFSKTTYVPLYIELILLGRDLLGAALLGIGAGLIVSYCCALVAEARWLVLLLAVVSSLLGLNEVSHTPYMLSFLMMGLTVANTSDQAGKIVAVLDRLTGFLCVIFFVLHGAELKLPAFVEAGWVGAAYIVFRSTGKYFGIRLTARVSGERPEVQRWLGSCLVAQAGAAIALASVTVQRNPELGHRIQTIILGTVVFFEIVGPLLIRYSVLQAGEVPLAHAVHHSSSSAWEELYALVVRVLSNLGYDVREKRRPENLFVKDFVRRTTGTLRESASFADVVRLIAHSHDNTYPVVDNESRLVGIIRYSDISRVLFDREVTSLVNAADLARPIEDVLYPDDPITKALALFRHGRNDSIPVVDREDRNRLIGMIRRRDVTAFLAGQHNGGELPSH
ncbi:MAG: CBS domain-containing protein [Planctomycetes bacterium]|nr:CBS domain-containing protein [Planctomycetota bacterium]